MYDGNLVRFSPSFCPLRRCAETNPMSWIMCNSLSSVVQPYMLHPQVPREDTDSALAGLVQLTTGYKLNPEPLIEELRPIGWNGFRFAAGCRLPSLCMAFAKRWTLGETFWTIGQKANIKCARYRRSKLLTFPKSCTICSASSSRLQAASFFPAAIFDPGISQHLVVPWVISTLCTIFLGLIGLHRGQQRSYRQVHICITFPEDMAAPQLTMFTCLERICIHPRIIVDADKSPLHQGRWGSLFTEVGKRCS